MTIESVRKTLELWKTQGVRLNPGASREELARLQGLVGHPIPDVLVQLYSAANGMADDQTDRWHLSVWSIDRILREHDVREEGGVRWLAFADFLIYSWAVYFDSDGRVWSEGTDETFVSVDDFLHWYTTDPGSLGLVEAV